MSRGGHPAALSTVAVFLLAAIALAAAPRAVGDPVASVWYRGVPAGVPRLDDLAEIKALGFSGVTWPLMSADGGPELRRLADIVGLTVVIRDTPAPRSEQAPRQSEYLNVPVASMPAERVAAAVWRAIAHGARVISFDAGVPEGTGLSDRTGRSPAWVAPAAAIGRQVDFNGRLIGAMRPGPEVTVDAPAPESLDVTLADADRSWVVIATNLSGTAIHAAARFPRGVPYALWLNLLDGSTMSMRSDPAGPRWTFDLAPWAAKVYVIDKNLKILN